MKSRTIKILIGLAFAAGLFALPASAQVIPTNLWNPNYASNTITPRPSTLQIPCANIVGGCVSGGATSTFTVSAGTGLSVSVASGTNNNTTSTVTLNLNGGTVQNCSNQGVSGLTATGTIVCTADVFSVAGVSTGTIQISGANGLTVTTSTNTITLSLPQALGISSAPSFAGITVGTSASSSIGTTLTASTNEQGLDHGTYVDTLCQAGLTNASSVTVNFPQEIISTTTGYQYTVPILDTYNGGVCTYNGGGPQGTEWYWNGTTSTPATSENGGDANAHWGYGMNSLSLFGNYISNSTGLLIGGATPGGGQGVSNNNLVIKYFNVDESIATNTYLMMQTGGYVGAASTSALVYNSVANAGEGLLFDHVTFADTVQASSVVQNCIAINGGFSSIEFTNSHFDDCGQTISSAASFGTEVNTGDYWENTAGDTIGAVTPIVNNSAGVTVENFGGQFTQDASNSVPAAFISNSGLFLNYGTTAFKNGTGTMARFVADNGTGQDQLFGWSNPNGAVTSYKSVQADNGLTTFLSESGNNLFPFQMKISSTTGVVSIVAGGASQVISSVASSGWLLAAQTALNIPTVEIRAGSGVSSTLQMADATHYGCIAWGTPSGFVYQYATTTSPFIISTTTQPAWCNQ